MFLGWNLWIVQIRIVLVSDDEDYSQAVLAEMTKIDHDLVIQECSWADVRQSCRESLFPVAQVHCPTIMMLDFGFIRRAFHKVVEQVQVFRKAMAIECLVMRPPADESLSDRLKQLGLWVYDVAPARTRMAELVH